MATFKDIVKQTLLKHCLEVTEQARSKEQEKFKGKLSREQVRDMEAAIRLVSGWNSDQCVSSMLKVVSIATGLPEIMEPVKIHVPEMAIVVVERCRSDHHFDDSRPYIATCDNEKASGYLLHEDGSPSKHIYEQRDDPRFATDEECKDCIESLTDEQFKTIMAHSFFHPIILEAMNKQISISEEPEGGDVIMADGRTLMV